MRKDLNIFDIYHVEDIKNNSGNAIIKINGISTILNKKETRRAQLLALKTIIGGGLNE